MKEIWKKIEFDSKCGPSREYLISNYGNVMVEGKPARIYHNGAGYLKCARGFIHYLVTQYFIGPRPEGYVINHKDGDKTNNRLDNLEYVTLSYNAWHSVNVLNKPVWQCTIDKTTKEDYYSKLSKKLHEHYKHADHVAKNSIWVFNDVEQRRIHQNELDEFLSNGYKLGRNMSIRRTNLI